MIKLTNALNYIAEYCASEEMQNGFDNATLDNLTTKLFLVVSECTEAGEALRKEPTDIDNLHEEIADALIRLLAIAGSLKVDLDGIVVKKLAYNKTRGKKHGKRF